MPLSKHPNPPVLMSRENPNGWKLESLTEKLREEINRKSLNIAGDQSVEAQLVTHNNFQIIGLLMQIEALQRESMVIMSQIGPDQGGVHEAGAGEGRTGKIAPRQLAAIAGSAERD